MISENGLELIKRWEGCSLNAYQDVAGVWTIGYGHTAGVHCNDVITQEEADRMLERDIIDYNTAVCKYNNRYGWSQNEEDALTSFCYNCGAGNLDKLLDRGKRSKEVIAEKMLLYNKAGGKVILGLQNRRKDEQKLFLTPDSPQCGVLPDQIIELLNSLTEAWIKYGESRKC